MKKFALALLAITLTLAAVVISQRPRPVVFQGLVSEIPPQPPMMGAHPRSPKWERVSRDFIERNPECAACSCREHLETHHVLPYHLHPELELVESNFIVLCREHHFRIGHKSNWQESNENVRADAAAERRKHR